MTRLPYPDADAAFRQQAQRFVESELLPHVRRWERRGTFPHAALRACGERGYLSLDPSRAAVFAEALAFSESMGVGLTVLVQSRLVGTLLSELGTPQQHTRYLKSVVAGRAVGAVAVSEPSAGSDLGGLQCFARSTRSGFRLSGEKTYITNAAAADFLIVAARLDTASDELTLFVVPSASKGIRVKRLPSMGLETTAMGHVTLRDCVVPRASLLGEAGGGYHSVQQALNRERIYGGIGVVAWAQRALEKTRDFLRLRRAFGRTLNRFQAVRHQMADLATSLEAARQLNYRAFARWVEGHDATLEIAMVKLFSYREAQRVVEACLQLHGGLGYLDSHWTSQWYRDARALTIAAGTPEVMRELIAAHLQL